VISLPLPLAPTLTRRLALAVVQLAAMLVVGRARLGGHGRVPPTVLLAPGLEQVRVLLLLPVGAVVELLLLRAVVHVLGIRVGEGDAVVVDGGVVVVVPVGPEGFRDLARGRGGGGGEELTKRRRGRGVGGVSESCRRNGANHEKKTKTDNIKRVHSFIKGGS